MNKILFCNKNGINPYHMSGAEETIDEILKDFALTGYCVAAFCCIERFLLYHNEYYKLCDVNPIIIQDIYHKCLLSNTNCYVDRLAEFAASYEPDIIFTQLFDISVLRNIVGVKTKIVCFIHGIVSKSDRTKYDGADLYVCMSKFIASSLPYVNRSVCVTYPLLKRSKYYIGPFMNNNNSILFVNPIKCKGVDIVISLTKIIRSEKFVIYENWTKTQRRYVDEIKKQSNIELRNTSSVPSEIYTETKLLLFPSQGEEGFGRCIVEANFNGIPAIASNVGGINEAIGAGQILIDDYSNVNVWETVLAEVLNSKDYYRTFQANAYKNSERFDMYDINELIERIRDFEGFD